MISEAQYVKWTQSALSVSFRNFIHRAVTSLAAGDRPAIVFQGVPLASLEKAEIYLSRLRFDSQQMAFSVADALVIGFWRCAGQGRIAVVRHSAAGWRVRLKKARLAAALKGGAR